MGRRRPETAVRLTSAIGILYAEVRCRTDVASPTERQAQHDAEDTLTNLLRSPLLVQRLAELMDVQP